MNAKMRWFRLVVLASCLFVCMLFAARADAHVVPPETFHPVAESHRRMTFMLNLNPILWETVRQDSGVVAAELRKFSEEDADAYLRGLDDLFTALETEASISISTPTMRKRTARGVYELTTTAVADTIRLHLEHARDELSNYDGALGHFESARMIWAAFEHEVRATDREKYRELGMQWLDCSGALGYPGMVGVGSIPSDIEIFTSESGHIIAYVSANFGEGYSAPEDGRLAPLPMASGTFDPYAVVPVKFPPGSDINKQLPRPRQILNMAERGVDESDTPLIALGDMAFDSPYIFGDPSTSLTLSCNTCHNKGVTNPNFFVPGLSKRPGSFDVSNAFLAPHANNAVFDPLDIPDLRGIRFTAPYGRNGRFSSLRDFVRNGIMHEFGGPEPDPLMLDAMIAYLNEFDFLPNPNLGANGTLADSASESAKRGEGIFKRGFSQMDNMSCATCHTPSNHFLDGKRHDIGSVDNSGIYSIDGALDTPTLLSSKFSAPYFHDGSLPTLRSVVEWFDSNFELGLSAAETADLTEYVETIGDGIDGYEDTVFTLESEMEEFSFFLSGYEYARRVGNDDLAGTIFRTVAAEIRAHKWDVQNDEYLPLLNHMAKLMDDAYLANEIHDRRKVDSVVEEYRTLYEANAGLLK